MTFSILLAFVLLAFQPAPITVADCLLQSGYSRAVPDTPITTLQGVDGWANGNGERVLQDGVSIGFEFLDDSDGARRMVSFYAYGGAIYVFVFKHPDDPGRRLPGEDRSVWHGDCLLRVESTGG
jgi:hypothetical protein